MLGFLDEDGAGKGSRMGGKNDMDGFVDE